MRFRSTFLIPLLLGAAPLMHAADVSFGAQLGAAMPTSDLKTVLGSKVAPTLGAHALVDFGEGHALRARLDYAHFSGNWAHAVDDLPPQIPGFTIASSGAKVRMVSLAMEYYYYLSGTTEEGFYLAAGLGLTQSALSADGRGTYGGNDVQFSTSRSRLSAEGRLGLGYQFNRSVGLELYHRFARVASLYGDNLNVAVAGLGNTTLSIHNTHANLNATVLGLTWRF